MSKRTVSYVAGSYIIEGSVCYLCICEQSYPRKLAFSYLEELAKEFNMSYGNEVDKPGLRPYAFVKFGKDSYTHTYIKENSH